MRKVTESLVGQELTFTVIKCDVGSIGGHTKPTRRMLDLVEEIMSQTNLVIDLVVTHTGDDIAIIMTHQLGTDSATVHRAARTAFEAAAEEAKRAGLYGAGQDLFPSAPSGNVRGTGPGVAEMSFTLLPEHRKAESIAVFAADKCGPGAFNLAIFQSLADPSRCSGFLLAPDITQGYTFVIEDMDHKVKEGEPRTRKQVRLNSPEDNIKILALLRNIDKYSVAAVISRAHPEEVAVATSTDRLHNITGKYQGKDDPVYICRNQGIFPAIEEIVDPFRLVPYVTGDARGSHSMPLTPVAIKTPVAGAYCVPLVSCLAFSVSPFGNFSDEYVDVFADHMWDEYRRKASLKADIMREQAPFGIAMASQEEIAYTGLQKLLTAINEDFELVPEVTRE